MAPRGQEEDGHQQRKEGGIEHGEPIEHCEEVRIRRLATVITLIMFHKLVHQITQHSKDGDYAEHHESHCQAQKHSAPRIERIQDSTGGTAGCPDLKARPGTTECLHRYPVSIESSEASIERSARPAVGCFSETKILDPEVAGHRVGGDFPESPAVTERQKAFPMNGSMRPQNITPTQMSIAEAATNFTFKGASSPASRDQGSSNNVR